MAIVDVYDNVRRLDLILTESGTPNWNPVMHENNFRLQKGTQNFIEFKVRDNDRKPINLLGKSLQCNINYPDGKVNLIQKELRMIDPQKGLVGLVLQPHDMMDWPLGTLSFNVTMDTDSGFSRMLYVSEVDSPYGWIVVDDGPYLGPTPSMTGKFYTNMTNDDPVTYVWSSDIFPGSNRSYNATGTMTMVLTTKEFSGTLKAYGSLESSKPLMTDEVWFPLDVNSSDSVAFDNFTGNTLVSLKAKVEWVMFEIIPLDYNPNDANQDASKAFSIDDVITSMQFRNI